MASGLEIGATLGGYKILARLRAGAMGVLYLGRRIGPAGFARPVAIKVIHDHLAQNRRFTRMFIEEAKLSARIDDPHVVRVEEFGEASGRYFLVMEYVHGVSLAQVLGVLRRERTSIPPDIAVAIAMQMTAGLHGAHEATDEEGIPLGIVHRDVSPHNVLVSYRGHVRIIDFGIAKARQQSGDSTQTGSLRGKLSYMPPEQARSAKHVDRRADLYAVGLVLWEMLVGKRMLDAPNDIALLTLIKNPPIIPPSAHGAEVPQELDAAVLACLSQDPEGRPRTAHALQRLLGEAYPPALKVLPSDIAQIMTKVRTLAQAAKETGDDTDLYGEEVKKTLTIFGRSMHESVELANDALGSSPSLEDKLRSPSVIIAEPTEDEPEAKKLRPRHAPTVRIDARDSIPESRPSAPPLQKASSPAMPPLAILAAVIALGCSSILLVVLIVRDHRRQRELERIVASSTTVTNRPSAAASAESSTPDPASTPTAIAVDDPAPPLPMPPTATVTPQPQPQPQPQRVGSTLNVVEKAREAAKEGNASEVRRLLEPKVRGGHGSTEEAALVRAACKAQRDQSCRDDIDRKYPSLTDPMAPRHL